MNFVDIVQDQGLRTASGDVVAHAKSGRVVLGVRPEDLVLHVSGPVLLRGKVALVENLGELVMAYVDSGAVDPVIVKLPGNSTVRSGDGVAFSADASRLHVFDAARNSIRG